MRRITEITRSIRLAPAYAAISFLILIAAFHWFSVRPTKVALDRAQEIRARSDMKVLFSSIITSLSTVANTAEFHDFLFSGAQTREEMKDQIEYLLFKLPHEWFVGHQIYSSTDELLFSTGSNGAKSSIELNVCYTNSRLDPDLGLCKGRWKIFLNPEFLPLSTPKGMQSYRLSRADFSKTPAFSVRAIENFQINLTDHQEEWQVLYLLELLLALTVVTITYLSGLRVRKLIDEHLTKPLLDIRNHLSLSNPLSIAPSAAIELQDIVGRFEALRTENEKYQEAKVQAELGALATQVSHDIRSPLAVLEILSEELGSVPDDERAAIRNAVNQIQDIANGLLSKARENALKASEPDSLWSAVTPVMNEIVESKRLEHRDKTKVKISLEDAALNADLRVPVKPTDLKRVISNLVNNSVEALGAEGGKVEVGIAAHSEQVVITVKDNGKGIPSVLLNDLGKRGASFGKAEGNGLGLYGAKEFCAKCGGSLEVSSVEGQGTVVTLRLPVFSVH